jgi:transcriptional regulator GlxA family with amidase domain
VRRRRAERASDLLAHTAMPIARIAQQVGVPDLHAFNRLLRLVTGRSPRRIRQEATRVVDPSGMARTR